MTSVSIILLAAGSSSRMGQSKQLLKIRKQSLLVHSINVALASGLRTIVVLGAHEQEHRTAIQSLPVDIVLNDGWMNGMGGSLKAGLKYLLLKAPLTEAVVVMVCDQPLLTTQHLEKIKAAYQTSGKQIVASYYSGTAGVPALFHKSLFSGIMNLTDDQGAKKLIQRHSTEVVSIDFPEGAVDLDTPDDYEHFIQ